MRTMPTTSSRVDTRAASVNIEIITARKGVKATSNRLAPAAACAMTTIAWNTTTASVARRRNASAAATATAAA